MARVYMFPASWKKPVKRESTKPRKRHRGQIAGLIPIGFLAEMCGVSRTKMNKFFNRVLDEYGVDEADLSPRQVGQFIEFVSSLRANKERSDISAKLF